MSHRHPIRISVFVDMNHSKLMHRNLFEGVALLDSSSQSDVKVDLWPISHLEKRSFLAEHPCSGIITQVNANNQRLLTKTGLPVVNVSAGTPTSEFPRVMSDQHWAGQCAAAYFLRRGFRHFGYIGYPLHNASNLRLQGYRAALEEKGHSVLDFEFSPADREDLSLSSLKEQRRLQSWLRRLPKPLALFCFCDAVAHVALRICLGADSAVPEEIALLGVDNDPMLSRILPVTLSSIDLQMTVVGREAGEVLLKWIRSGQRPSSETTLQTARIFTRRSTDRFAVGDELVSQAIDYMQEHLAESLSVASIAQQIHCSRRKLERRFRASLQMSVYDALRGIRIERASEEIASTDLPLKEIAPLFGFRDTQHMNAVFRQKLHRTSSSFRSPLVR